MSDFCIIVVGYNRPKSIERLLSSLSIADYEGDYVDLLISIDKGARQQEILEIAENYEWKNGKKTVRAFEEKQGLRAHIIQCGDISANYMAVIVLEDDITVSPYFYSYVKQTVDFYKDNQKIAGISLYKHHVNVGTMNFFEPEFNGYDAYLMQFAQSWGECWTSAMWVKFKKWYEVNIDKVFKSNSFRDDLIPDNILLWGDQSWLKYFMAYIVENDLYYVYPYHSLSTNHSEAGQHNAKSSGDWQVSLVSKKFIYSLPTFDNAVKYDIFFERIDQKISGHEDKKAIIDLYGNKKNFADADVLISSSSHPYCVLETRKLKYRPHEVNCSFYEEGDGLYVYDLHTVSSPPKFKWDLLRTRYDVRATKWKHLLKLGINEFIKRLWSKFKK